jgi:TamB, inner membrane protein subunit of TAM complex
MKLQVIKIRVYRWLRKWVLYGLYLALTFFVLSFFLLQLPAVQEALISRYTRQFSKVTDFNITFNKFYLRWYDQLEVEGLEIKDSEKNTMIAVKKLSVNFRLRSLLDNNDINIDGVDLKYADVHLKTIKESDTSRNLNINIFINKLNSSSSGSGGNPAKINIGEINLENSKFSLNETESDSIPIGFDYHHFKLGVEADLHAFKVIGDTIEFDLNSLQAKDQKTGLQVKNLSTFFRISQTAMEFYGINLSAGESFVSDTIVLKYKSQRDLQDFNNKVSINAKLKKTVIHPNDLALFNFGKAPLPEPLYLEGNITGKVSRFDYRNMLATLGSTTIQGRLQMDGLPTIEETFIDLDVKKGAVDINDLSFLFPENIFVQLKPLAQFRLQGKFTGFINDFVANGDFNGSLGRMKSDINLKINKEKIERSTYSGNLALFDFDLGKYFQDTTNFQKVNLRGQIKGTGLTERSADFFLNGEIQSIGLRGYNYTNISTNARFASQLFSGQLKIDDPNLQFNATGSIDLRNGLNQVKLKANLDTAQIDKLGLIKDHLTISTFLDINTKGLQIDSLFGDVIFKNTHIEYRDKFLMLDSVHLISTHDKLKRSLLLRSSFADIELGGSYYYSTLFNDLSHLYQEFKLNVKNDKDAIATYYSKKNKSIQVYEAAFKIKLNNINPLINLAGIDAAISKSTKIDGKFINGATSRLQAYANIDTIDIGGKKFFENEIELSGSKIRDSVNVLAMLSINSAKQNLSKAFTTKNLFSELIWDKGHIAFGLDADQEGTTNLIRLKSEIDFLQDSTKIKILPTRLRVLDKEWEVNQKNYTLNKGKEWDVHHLEIRNGIESILVNGLISKDLDKVLDLSVNNFNLDILNTISTEKFKGIVTGEIKARDLYATPYVQNDISIKELTVNDFLIGEVNGTNSWNQNKKQFDIDFTIDRLGKRTVSLNGLYNPEKTEPLLMNAKLEKTNLQVIEPFLKGIFSQIDGTLSGEYKITGSFSKPLVNGQGNIENGKLMIDYLKTLYHFSGALGMTSNQVIFDDIVLTDEFKNKGKLDGYLTHKNYTKFRIVLDADFKNFQLLNTTPKDNSLFYGQAFGTGNLNMLGPLENMKISATARSEKNTRIFIPMSTTQSAEKKDFITFLNLTDSTQLNKAAAIKKAKSEPTGITMDLNLDITPDAYAEIIMDIKSGDIIRGYGNGDIKLQLDTKGEFNMFGSYEFERGFYNFTLYDVINKGFSINKGSRISWYGDPYAGQLALVASYKQLTSLAPIIADQTVATTSQMRRKYPVEVLLKLDGAMLSPQINFDIVANDLPNNVPMDGGKAPVQLNTEFKAFKAKLDEQELKKQVFSLIILRRFSPPDAFTTSGALSSSVSELLSNQLSYWLTQVDQNLEIDFDLGNFDQEAFNTFQLRLSYSFLGGRLRVTRDGTFNNQYARTDVSNMLGDWTVDYLLTPDGKFKVKMYNRTNINQLTNTIGTQATITTGLSLTHTQSFNSWLELLTSARDRRRKEIQEEQNKKDEAEKEGSN